MRSLAVLLGTCVLAACGAGSGARSDTPERTPAADSAAEFLLTAAAADFHTRRPPDPMGFREVRMGRVQTPGGEEQYLLCGQFLPAQGGDTAEWTPFVTLKTSDTASLQRRLDSLP